MEGHTTILANRNVLYYSYPQQAGIDFDAQQIPYLLLYLHYIIN